MDYRYLSQAVSEDLKSRMVFLGGPRRVGKTTLMRDLLPDLVNKKPVYFNWDAVVSPREFLIQSWPAEASYMIFDELHKYRRWKSWIKGVYDTVGHIHSIAVTGSAKLDIYRRGGDSLQGRYHYYRLHPLSIAELEGTLQAPQPFAQITPRSVQKKSFEQLLRFGGFPEPFFAGTERALRRWQNERLERFFREDVRDLTLIQDLTSMRLLADLLPQRAGSLLSVNSLREDLKVSHRAVSRWMDVLEYMYHIFRIYPYRVKSVRGLQKEPKLYLWDWSTVPDDGARLENLVASHLLKLCHRLTDEHGYRCDLRFLRDHLGREVDFLMLVDNKPWFAVEVKSGDAAPSPALTYYLKKMKIPGAWQISARGTGHRIKDGINFVPAADFLAALS